MEVDETLPATTPASSGKSLAVGVQAGGRYKVLRFVAAGAMGEVYAAEDLIIGTTVALKVLRAELQGSSNAIARLRREIALARQVTDVHVCRVHDVGEHEGRVFLTMELLEGKTLADHLAASGPLSIAEVERLARQLVAGLAALHRTGIVHRDFKLANTMLVGERLVITDFGLARSAALESSDANLTAEAAVLGTPAYMAPEQAQGKPATAASDIYALGVVLFELLTGKRPFTGDSAMEIATARLTQDPPRPSTLRAEIPARWDAIVLRCLEREPAARFARADDVLGESAAPPRSSRARLGIAAVAVVGLGIGGFAAVRDRGGPPASSPPPAPLPTPTLRERQLTAFGGRSFVSTVALSRDGNRIAYQAGGLWVRDLDREEPTPIDAAPDRISSLRVLDWFPDGQRLLVRTQETGGFGIQILDLRDRSMRMWRIVSGARPVYAYLSPTADRVAYFGFEGVYVAPLTGTGETLVFPTHGGHGYQLAWSPDGTWIAAIRQSLDAITLHVIAADGSRSTTLPGLAGTTGVAWPRDRTVYVSRPAKISGTSELCRVGVVDGAWDRQAPHCIWKFTDTEIDWLRIAGTRAVFMKNATVDTIETMPLDAAGGPNGPRSQLPGQEGPNSTWGFASDGRLLLTLGRSGRARIATQRPSDALPKLVSMPVGEHDDDLAVADKAAILFTRTSKRCELIRREGDREITLLSEERSGNVRCPYLRCSGGTPNRCVLVRLTAASYGFRRFDLSTGQETGQERRRPIRNENVDLSPDGSTLVWGIEDVGSPALAVLEFDSGTYREIRPKGGLVPHDVSWFDADSWLVTGVDPDRSNPVVVRMRSDGRYDRLASDGRIHQFHNPFRSPDGTFLVFVTEQTRTDVFALEGFE